jgi:hypothetical protein
MAKMRWKLADYLEAHELTPYRLAKQLGSSTRMNTVYRLARRGQEPTRVDLATLATVMEGLRKLTGEEIKLDDVLEFVPSPERDTETAAWLNSDLSRLGEYEPYDWGEEDPEALGRAVRYEPGRGLVVEEDHADG